MDESRLEQQITFLLELDKLKHVLRQSILLDTSRRENDVEHSWHFAMMVMILGEYAPAGVNRQRVMKMALVHDIVEIDAGDVFIYGEQGGKAERECTAADRIFALLPPDQAAEIRGLWDEFEGGMTPEARFAKALDRIEPLLLNYYTQGKMWRQHGVTAGQVRAVNYAVLADGAPELADYLRRLIEDAVEKGYLPE
ncbi:MAG: HD domain-containing protein [Armatimonadota bacterium]